MSESLENKLNNLPADSGVYIMKNSAGEIIYVGKAKNLKNRVKQYFSNSTKHEKVQAMVDRVCEFDYIITHSEVDALNLEANLIKKHKPPYNILLKDDKYFPYIKINFSEDFPKVEVTRKVLKDNAKYFGPFIQMGAQDIVNLITYAFCLRNCKTKITRINKRPCLNYHIKKCVAPCGGLIDQKSYLEILKKAVHFLKGNDDEIEELITKKMLEHSEREEFELALEMKKQLAIIEKIKQKKVVNISKNVDIDVFDIVSNGYYSTVCALYIRDGRMTGAKNIQLTDASMSETDTLQSFLLQNYSDAVFLPDEIVITHNLQAEELEQFFFKKFNKRVAVTIAKKGVKYNLGLMAQKNAREYLEKSVEKMKREEDLTVNACEQLCRILNINSVKRIECYDISNLSGVDKVASMTVMKNGICVNSLYRKFKIKLVEEGKQDDYLSLNETLQRRLLRLSDEDVSFSEKPYLILIDGGIGQLNAVKGIVSEYNIPVISIAKAEELVYTTSSAVPIKLNKSNLALRMLQRIRDEAHRFAITYNRSLRNKNLTSVLEKIPNIGKAKRAKLLKHFRSVENIKSAEISELEKIVSSADAKNIMEFFKNELKKSQLN